MKHIVKMTFLLIGLVTVLSCKKDAKEQQRQTILLTKPSGWLMTKEELAVGDSDWQDVTDTNPFNADDILVFHPTFYWEWNEGELKLPADPQIISYGEWSFSDGAKKIKMSNGDELEILELTTTSLQTKIKRSRGTFRYTFKHPF